MSNLIALFFNVFSIRLILGALFLFPLLVMADTSPEGEESKQDATNNQEVEKKPSFNVFEFKIDGNTVLDKGTIEKTVYPFLGESKTIDDIEQARAALEKAYQDAGYLTVTVSIPQQEVDKNLVKLLVTEGAVERLRIKDAKYSSLAEIKSRVGEFSEGKVPNFTLAQQQLGTVNRGQNRQVTPILRPGRSPSKVEVDLKVQDQLPLHGNLELNDRYSANTTRTRLNGGLRYENLWQKDHSLGISFQVSPQDINETQVLSATYLIPSLNGEYFAAYGVISNSDINAVGDTNVIGKGYVLGARYIHPLPVVEGIYQSLTLGVDYKNFDESVNLLGSDGFKTPISYTAFAFGYDGTYQAESFQTQLNLTLNLALRGMGNEEAEFADKRFLAKPNYGFLRTDLKHTQKLPADWVLQAKLSGQIASGPLVSSEQFSIGGVGTVRGYLESSELGDNGLLGSLELRTPSLKKYFKSNQMSDAIKEWYAFAFVDAGKVSIYKPLSTQSTSSDIASVGLGFTFKSTRGIFTDLDYAHALRDSTTVERGDDRLHFRLGYEW